MSSLTDIDKRYLEKILNMGGGYVLDYSDATFAEFFARHNVPIHSQKYQTYGTSKAKKMRAFWEQEPDLLVGKVIGEMLEAYEAGCELSQRQVDARLLDRCRTIIRRLLGKEAATTANDEASFLEREFTVPDIHKLPIEAQVAGIIEGRLKEARLALNARAYLSVILLCGSVLEGVLLGVAQRKPEIFNRSSASPKDNNGKPKPFQEWTLAQLIDVASDVGLLKLDVKKFSHGLRDFRNYIHPYQQLMSGFAPDEHTAKVCFQVLKAALASLTGSR